MTTYLITDALHSLALRNDSPFIRRKDEDLQKRMGSDELEDPRNPFQHDRDRILYSKAFRRLMHKTQVTFTGEMNEHIRTRLTHTLEVAQIARTIARQVCVNEDLVEAIALGHDVGHTPFGHSGEKFLNDCLYGKNKIFEKFNVKTDDFTIGFKHNYQSVRVLMEIEKGYGKEGDSLNLTYPVLEGVLKHTSIKSKNAKNELEKYPEIVGDGHFFLNFEFSTTIEGQIVGLADEIAQRCHDIEDAYLADYHTKKKIVNILSDMVNKGRFIGIEENSFIRKQGEACRIDTKNSLKPFISWIIGKIVIDSVEIIRKNMDDYALKNEYLLRSGCIHPITDDIATEKILNSHSFFNLLRDLQRTLIINNYTINRENGKANYILNKLFKAYMTNPKQLPDGVLKYYTETCSIKKLKEAACETNIKELNIRYIDENIFDEYLPQIQRDNNFIRYLCDYVALMTDLFAVSEFQKLYLGATNKTNNYFLVD